MITRKNLIGVKLKVVKLKDIVNVVCACLALCGLEKIQDKFKLQTILDFF